jgi:hypothetical protein
MVHFFGILAPDFGEPVNAVDAPQKVGFFGGLPEDQQAGDLSRAEKDAAFLAGKRWEPDPAEWPSERPYAFLPRFVP